MAFTITSISPEAGTTSGGTPFEIVCTEADTITLLGVTFGDIAYPSPDAVVVSATSIQGTTPAHPAGEVSVSVDTGHASELVPGSFTFEEESEEDGSTMADVYGTNETIIRASGFGPSKGSGATVRYAEDEYEAAALASGSSIVLNIRLDTGDTPLWWYLLTDDLGNSTLTLEIGLRDMDGTAIDLDGFASNIDASSAVYDESSDHESEAAAATAGIGIAMTKPGQVVITTAGSNTGTGTIKFGLMYASTP